MPLCKFANESDRQTVVNALYRCARDDAQYAASFADSASPGDKRLAEQFERQAADSKRLAIAIENDE